VEVADPESRVTVSIYRIKGTKNFMLDVTGPDGRRVRKSSGTDNPAEARRKEAALLIDLESGTLFDSPPKSLSIGELAERFLAYELEANPRSHRTYHAAATKAFLAWIGKDKLLNAVTLEDLQRYQAHRASTASRATANRNFQVLKTMFSLAVDWQLLTVNPATKIKRFKETAGKRRFLTLVEQEQLLCAAQEPFRTLLFVALRTGLRRKDLLNLKVRDCDFSRSLVTLVEAKTDSLRCTRLLPVVREKLEALAQGLAPDAYLFRSSSGGPYTAAGVESNFRRTIKRAQLVVRFHDLRHTFASDCLAAGMSLAAVRDLMNHRSVATTERYAKLSDEYLRREMDALSGYLAAKSAPKPQL
jgi:site-specific recombinase XerD